MTKIGWILSVDRGNAASRLQGYLVDEWLQRHAVDSEIIAIHSQKITGPFDYNFIKIARKLRREKFTHIVFESPEWPIFQLALLWKLWGGISICVRCDNVTGQYDTYFDATILPTATLADALHVQRRKIIPDSVEVPPQLYKDNYLSGKKIQVVWVGHQGYAEYLKNFIASLQKNAIIKENFSFTLISKGDFATKQWSEKMVLGDILDGDIAIIPIPEGAWFTTKSSNRLAMMMALGMPIVASRIPSYQEIGEHGRNVLFADDEASMLAALCALQNADSRASLGKMARNDIGDQFSMEKIGFLWKAAILETRDAFQTMPPASLRIRLLSWLLKVV